MGNHWEQALRWSGMILWAVYLALVAVCVGEAAEPVPNRIVVLTFDDAAKSHYTFVRPILTGSPVDSGKGGHSLWSAWNRT